MNWSRLLEHCWCFIVIVACLHIRWVLSLQSDKKVAIDKYRELEHNQTVRSVCGYFRNNNSFWLQLWKEHWHNMFRIDWQYEVQPIANKSVKVEVIDLSEDAFVTLGPGHRLAILNHILPGPVMADYRFGGGVVEAINTTTLLPIPIGTLYEFDDLELPYHIPVYLCNETGCPQCPHIMKAGYGANGNGNGNGQNGKSKPKPASGKSTDSMLLSNNMIIGLIAWNVILTVILFIVVLSLMLICADLEKRKKSDRIRLVPDFSFPRPWFDHMYVVDNKY